MEKVHDLLKIQDLYSLMPFWSASTVKNYAMCGKIPSIKVGGKMYFSKKAIEKFVSSITEERESNYGK